MFGRRGDEAIMKELHQIHNLDTYIPSTQHSMNFFHSIYITLSNYKLMTMSSTPSNTSMPKNRLVTLKGQSLTTYNKQIWVPKDMRSHLIQWYHISLMHNVATQMLNTIGIHFGYPGIHHDCEELVKKCNKCQCYKITGKRNYGKIPLTPKLHDKEPWHVIHVNCMGPWTVNFKNEVTGEISQFKLDLLTVADACLGWAKFAIMANKAA